MRFNAKKLGTVDENAKNIFKVAAPIYLLNKGGVGVGKKWVIFFGNNFKNMQRGTNISEYIKINNQCLDFIRRECADCELLYKPHPAETDEFKLLKLDHFKIVEDKNIGELFLYENLDRIKYVFSVCSAISLAAYSLGLNSYVFARLFKPAFSSVVITGYEDYLSGMPDLFYIYNLDSRLKENKEIFKKDVLLEECLRRVLNKNSGKIWFTTGDPAFILIMMSIAKLIKTISPGRELSLVAMHHERWDSIDLRGIRELFDEVVFFPMVHNSLRPAKLLNFFRATLVARRYNVGPEDVFIGAGPGSFIENCLMSYFKKNYSIAITTQKIFEHIHKFESPLDVSDFEIKLSALIFNTVIDPLLGLNRTVRRLRRPSGRNGFYLSRYQKAVDDVFDEVYVFKLTNNEN